MWISYRRLSVVVHVGLYEIHMPKHRNPQHIGLHEIHEVHKLLWQLAANDAGITFKSRTQAIDSIATTSRNR